MKDIKTYLNEAKKTILKKEYPMKKKETYGELGEKWFDKCRKLFGFKNAKTSGEASSGNKRQQMNSQMH